MLKHKFLFRKFIFCTITIYLNNIFTLKNYAQFKYKVLGYVPALADKTSVPQFELVFDKSKAIYFIHIKFQ